MALRLLALLLWSSTVALAQSPDATFSTSMRVHGETAVAAASTLVVTGHVTSRGDSQPIKISAALDGKVRLDYGQPVRRSVVTTLQGRFEVIDGRVRPKAPHSGAYAQLDLLSVLGVRHLAAGGVRRIAIGSGSIHARATLRFKAITGRQQTHYGRAVRDETEVDFDQETGLVAGIARQQYADESLDLAFVAATHFSDYRNVGGLRFPFRIERYLDGVLQETIVVDAVQLNPVFPTDLFER